MAFDPFDPLYRGSAQATQLVLRSTSARAGLAFVALVGLLALEMLFAVVVIAHLFSVTAGATAGALIVVLGTLVSDRLYRGLESGRLAACVLFGASIVGAILTLSSAIGSDSDVRLVLLGILASAIIGLLGAGLPQHPVQVLRGEQSQM